MASTLSSSSHANQDHRLCASRSNAQEMAPRDGALIPGITSFADNAEEAYSEIKRHIDVGVDQIKLSMSGEEITEKLRAEDTVFPDEVS